MSFACGRTTSKRLNPALQGRPAYRLRAPALDVKELDAPRLQPSFIRCRVRPLYPCAPVYRRFSTTIVLRRPLRNFAAASTARSISGSTMTTVM